MGEDRNSDALREKERKKNETEKNDQILIAFGVITFSPHELPKNARCPH
jgi:hypothetical protein